MKEVVLQDNVINEVDHYIYQYKEYFHSLYIDTGVFGLEQILEYYEQEAENRRQEIVDIILTRFSKDIVLGRTPQNTILVNWRSKTLWFTWQDEGDIRIITDLIIR